MPRQRGEPPSCASSPVELIEPNPRPAAAARSTTSALRRAGRVDRASAACCSRCSSARWPAAATSWSPASAAGAPRSWPASSASRRSSASRDDAERARGGADREHGARGPQPGRGGARLRRAGRGARPDREEVGRRVGRSRVAISNLMRLLDLPDEALDAARGRRADRGPRPRAAAGRRPRRPPPARPRGRRRGLVGARDRGGARARPSGRAQTARERAGRDPSRPRSAPRWRSPRTLGAALGRDVRVRPRGTGYKVELALRRPRRGAAALAPAPDARREPPSRAERRYTRAARAGD